MMNKEDISFLLRYAKVGVLHTMKDLDEIASQELKEEYVRLKKELLTKNPKSEMEQSKNGDEKPSAVKKWFGGIGARQQAYKDKHKDDLL